AHRARTVSCHSPRCPQRHLYEPTSSIANRERRREQNLQRPQPLPLLRAFRRRSTPARDCQKRQMLADTPPHRAPRATHFCLHLRKANVPPFECCARSRPRREQSPGFLALPRPLLCGLRDSSTAGSRAWIIGQVYATRDCGVRCADAPWADGTSQNYSCAHWHKMAALSPALRKEHRRVTKTLRGWGGDR